MLWCGVVWYAVGVWLSIKIVPYREAAGSLPAESLRRQPCVEFYNMMLETFMHEVNKAACIVNEEVYEFIT